MATCTEEHIKKYYLTLDEEEVTYIKELVQNTQYERLADEPPNITKLREAIWTALNCPSNVSLFVDKTILK